MVQRVTRSSNASPHRSKIASSSSLTLHDAVIRRTVVRKDLRSHTSRSVPSQPFDASSCASTFAREKITFPSPLLRTGVQAHRANAVLARSRDSSKMSQSPVQTSTPPLLKHARPYCFPEKRLEQGAWREAPTQSCIYTHVCMFMYKYLHMCRHMYIFICTCTHMCIYV